MTKLVLSVLAALVLALVACREEGPAERAGRQIDEAVRDARETGKQAIDDLGDELDEAGRDAEEAAEQARAKARKALE